MGYLPVPLRYIERYKPPTHDCPGPYTSLGSQSVVQQDCPTTHKHNKQVNGNVIYGKGILPGENVFLICTEKLPDILTLNVGTDLILI